MTTDEKERKLKERLQKLDAMEREILQRETALKARAAALPENRQEKKQLVLRLSKSLWDDVARWAEEDFRSINGQIEYLLSEAVRRHKSAPPQNKTP